VSALEPGFYMATVEGVPNIPIMITDEAGRGFTMRKVPDTPYGTYGHNPSDITDARPLIVLDLENPAAVVRSLREATQNGADLPYLDQVAASIEAQTRPPRIPEPGLWGVVEAGMTDLTAREFVRVSRHMNCLDWKPVYATPDEYGGCVDWDELIDPTLIREGLS